VGSSPVSVAIPAGDEPPLVMDMSSNATWFTEELFAQLPVAVLKSMALAGVVRALGGEFAGIHKEEFKQPRSRWVSNQGSFILIIDVSHFMPVDELKEHMDRFIGKARQCRPLPGMERAELAGGLEWQWERDNRVVGIPLGDDHRQMLQEMADELGVETPFAGHEDTRF
jgi:L-2-hydroxycarboxylate dehydrogenase (NAD+)